MEEITIQVKDKQKAQALINFLRTLDFVEEVSAKDTPLQSKGKANDKEFFALAGLWAGRDMTLDSLRGKAWPRRS